MDPSRAIRCAGVLLKIRIKAHSADRGKIGEDVSRANPTPIQCVFAELIFLYAGLTEVSCANVTRIILGNAPLENTGS
jgi:hypothetical protein